MNCQECGHTRSYSGYPSRCVRCGAFHPSFDCPNPPGTPPKCALCQGSHPASYRGCSVYKYLQRHKKPLSNVQFNNVRDKSRVVQDSHPPNRTHTHEFNYAEGTSGQNDNHPSPAAPDINSMSSFLQEFKALINPLIALLTKVITCLLDKKND